ncbi:MAG: hypothetical protein ACREDU_09075 [Methylocella sp.]
MTGLRNLAGALALAFSLLVPGNAMAAGEPCTSRAALTAFVGASFPEARIFVLEKAEARLFLATLIGMAPNAQLAADEILIADTAPAAPAVRVVLFKEGCMSRMGVLPRSVVRATLIAIARSGA